MDYKKLSLASALALGCVAANAQEITTWSGDRSAAVSFTFDDGAPSQVSDAGPVFDKYGYKGTFNLVTGWNPDWSGFQKMADNGHEIASHSDSHGQNMSGEEASSKNGINGKIKQKYGVVTVAYPNCNVPNANAVKENYIVGRICNGSWQSVSDVVDKKGPSDWTKVPALMTGETGINTTDAYKNQMNSAIQSGGWVSFLTHGFQGKNNGNANYSPTNLDAMEGALKWASENDSKVWVAPMGFVGMYIKERNASKVDKKSGDANSITFEVTHSIKDGISDYDYPLTIKIKNDNNWTKVKATQGGADIEATIKDGNILVDAVPNAGDVVVTNGDAGSAPVAAVSSSSEGAPVAASSSSEAVAPAPASSSVAAPTSNATAPASSATAPASSSSGDLMAMHSTSFDASFVNAYTDNNGYIVVRGAKGMKITVINSLGHVVRTTRGLGLEQKVYTGAKGMYIVRVGGKAWKVNIK